MRKQVLTDQELQQLKEMCLKLAQKKRKKTEQRFEFITRNLRKPPWAYGRHVKLNGGGIYDKNSFLVYYDKKDKYHRLDTDAHVRHEGWTEMADESIASQLLELYKNQVINEETDIIFEREDWERKWEILPMSGSVETETYNRSWEYTIKLKELLPFIIKIEQEELEKA